MKTVNVRNLRSRLLGFYIIFALGCSAGIIGFSAFRWKEHQNAVKQNSSLFRQMTACSRALTQAVDAARNMSLYKTTIFAEESAVRIQAFRKNAEIFKESLNSVPDNDCRIAAEDLLNEAKNAQTVALSCGSELEQFPDPQAKQDFARTSELLIEHLSAASDDMVMCRDILRMQEVAQDHALQTLFLHLLICLAVFFAASFLITLTGFLLIGRTLAGSLKELSEGTRELRSGNLDYRFKSIEPDEIGQLKYDFNMMAGKIQTQSAELHTAITRLQEHSEQLIQAHQHTDRFLSNMSHELRTPLNSIIGFTELLQQRASSLKPEKIESYSTRILTASEHLLALITSLLDLAKSGAGTLKPVFTEFDVSASIQEFTEILKPLADKKMLAVTTEIDSDIRAYADRRMIRQIFINLFSNAVKYTIQGSIEVRLKDDGPDFLLEVQDTGIGIPEKEQPKLFRDFYRVDNGPGFLADGVGLGLVLSKRLAMLHHGSLTFTSAAGTGSTFILRCPKVPEGMPYPSEENIS